MAKGKKDKEDAAEPAQRAIGYIRLSVHPDKQAARFARSGDSLGQAAQREIIENMAKARQWELLRIEEDLGETGANLDREGIQRALADLKAGEADVLLVAKLDRLSRNISDFAGLMEVAKHQGWKLVAVDVGLDMSTPMGELMATILAAFAQYERMQLIERTNMALDQARKRGIQLGRPRNLPDHVVDYIIRLREEGHGWRAIATQLETDGVPTARDGKSWYASTVKSIVRSRRPDLAERPKE